MGDISPLTELMEDACYSDDGEALTSTSLSIGAGMLLLAKLSCPHPMSTISKHRKNPFALRRARRGVEVGDIINGSHWTSPEADCPSRA